MNCGKCNTCGTWMEKCPQCNGRGVYRDGYSCRHCRGTGCICPKKGGHSKGGSGCFITTATLLATGKNDNCEELTVFRNFRDNWLVKQKDGRAQIEEYYIVAPLIVSKIDNIENASQIYQRLWDDEIKLCYELILKERFEEARERYLGLMVKLNDQYLPK